MRDENRSTRRKQIEKAAYEILQEQGFASASMLKIAKRAKASNETLYNWYGDKQGLFLSLVVRNASDIKQVLEKQISQDTLALECLEKIGPKLLTLLVGDKAIALNRAAASDPTGQLGKAIAAGGRNDIAPLIGKLFDQARDQNLLTFKKTDNVVEQYLGLLVGDLQIRRAIGAIPQPSKTVIDQRAKSAFEIICQLLGSKP